LFIVIDVFSNLDEFLSMSEKSGNLLGIMCDYYGARLLSFFDRTSALIALVAATFTVTALQRTNELAALMAAGIPKARVVAPLVGGVIVVSLLAAANRELLVPRFRSQLMRNAQDWEGQSKKELQPRYDNQTDILIAGRYTLAAEQRILQPAFRLPYGLGDFGNQLSATDAYYQAAQADRPGGYLLVEVEQPGDLAEIASVWIEGRPILLSPRDTPWLEPKQCFVVSDVNFDQLAAGSAWRQYSSTPELIAGLHNPSLDLDADVSVTVHTRFVQPLLDVTLFFLGLPLVLAKESRNVFVAVGLCVLIVAIFFLVTITFSALGQNYLISASLAAWAPLLIFVPVARYVSQSLWQ
jgi:lipopolysaccharide export system permease protein